MLLLVFYTLHISVNIYYSCVPWVLILLIYYTHKKTMKKSEARDETLLSKDSFVKMRINDRDTEKACDLVRRKEKWMEIKD